MAKNPNNENKELSSADLDFLVVEDDDAKTIKVDEEGRVLPIYRNARLKRKLAWATVLIVLSGSLYLSLQMLFGGGARDGFPAVKPGSYLGTVAHVFPEGNEEHAILYVERQLDDDSLFFAVLKNGYKPETFNLLGETGLPPINIVSADGKLRFTGTQRSPGVYSGDVSNLDTRAQGEWTLSLIPESGNSKPSAEIEQQVTHWLKLRAALYSTDAKIKMAESTVPEQKKEIEKLTNFLTEGKTLKTRSDKKLIEVQAELTAVQSKLKNKQREAKELAKQLEVSQHVTNAGKLVVLSRDSLDREKRWIESMFKTSPEESSGDLAREIERGERILDLRAKIEEAKNKLSRLIRERGTGAVVGGDLEEPTNKDIDGFSGRY